jgi:hypothetical protein
MEFQLQLRLILLNSIQATIDHLLLLTNHCIQEIPPSPDHAAQHTHVFRWICSFREVPHSINTANC